MSVSEASFKVFSKLPKSLRNWIKAVYRRVSTVFYLLSFTSKSNSGLRILGVVDFNNEGFGLGDGFAFQAFLRILMIKHQAIGIDVAYIDDQTHPNARRQPYKRPLHLKRNLSMIHEFNPWVKSHFHFDSNAQFNDFLSRVKSNYIVWPILYDRFKYRGLYDRKAMIDFFKKEGYLPKLTCRQELINWAHDFCSDKLKNRKLIVIQIRNNPTRRTDKNANISAWIDFFKKRSQSPDFYFVIIGEEEEIIAKLRDQSNISFSKDFKTSFEQDVALMQIAFLVMASPSGPAEFSRYCGVPSLIFGVNPKYTEDVKAGQDYPFASDILKIFWGKETLELIDREFDLLYEHLLEINWRNPYSFKPVDNYPHRF